MSMEYLGGNIVMRMERIQVSGGTVFILPYTQCIAQFRIGLHMELEGVARVHSEPLLKVGRPKRIAT